MAANLNNDVLNDYLDALKDLTFNSRIHINTLTTIAQENKESYREYVQAIRQRILTAPPLEKLPSLYLMDSLIKNIGEPYRQEFAKFIVEIFCEAYKSIKDMENQKPTYVKLLKTWVGPKLFPPQALEEIHRKIGLGAAHQQQVRPQQPSPYIHANPSFFQPTSGGANVPPAPMMTTTAAAAPIPHHHHAPPHHRMMQHQQQQPAHMMMMMNTIPAPQHPGAMMRQSPPQLGYPQQQPMMMNRMYQPPPQQQQPPMAHPYHTAPIGQMNDPYAQQQQPMGGFHPYGVPADKRNISPIPTTSMASAIQNLVQKLNQPMYCNHAISSLVFSSPIHASASTLTTTATESFATCFDNKLNDGGDAGGTVLLTPFSVHGCLPATQLSQRLLYHRHSTSGSSGSGAFDTHSNRGSSAALPRDPVSRGIALLYNVPFQCSNCGLRFKVKQELEEHLDRHFKQNTLKTPNRVLSRKWYQSETSWIAQAETEVAGDPGAIFFKQMDEEKRLAQQQYPGSNLNYNSSSDLLNSINDDYIEPVTVNPEHNRCPLCKEELEQKFDSDMQEWVYTNAVQHKQTGLIAHRFCMPALLASSSSFNNNNNSTDSQSQENIDRKRSRDATDSSSPDGEQPSSSSNDIPPAKRIKTL